MKWFKLYIGDYQRDTADLSLAEHGAYLLMLQHYYATGKPLPTGKALHRMLRASDKDERAAIDAMVVRFWTVTDEGLINGRADIEIGKASDQASTNQRIAQAREEARRSKRNEHEACSVRDTKAQPNQIPDTRSPSLRSGVGRGSRLPADWLPEVGAEGWGQLEARELPKFRDYWIAQPGQRGVKADWQATWRNWLRKASEHAESGRTGERLSAVERTKRDSEEWARRQGGDGVLAANGELVRPQVDERLRVVAGRSVDISPDDVGF